MFYIYSFKENGDVDTKLNKKASNLLVWNVSDLEPVPMRSNLIESLKKIRFVAGKDKILECQIVNGSEYKYLFIK